MKKSTFDCNLLLFVLMAGVSGLFGQQKKIYEMTNQEIDQLVTTVSAQNLTITDRIRLYSEKFLDMPYNLTCAGDGSYALYETWPLVNFKETNCMVYCEHVLALSISDSWDNFFNNLQQIRYKDGVIGMRTRNHYTMVDWLPENSWLLEHVSRKVGGEYTKQSTRTISHRKFFEGKGITDLRYVLPDRTVTLDYVPKDALAKVEKNIRNG
ncbi:MAG: N-acetylmuramoyl-L-alanine amidase-like domain-containing protein, partial [Candidatus Neomarinimicrobiota bacterium]